jgi:signal transduction histidine kinase
MAVGNRRNKIRIATLQSTIGRWPCLPAGLTLAASKGLGMKIVRAVVKRIGGTLQFASLQFASEIDGRGARVTVVFEFQP